MNDQHRLKRRLSAILAVDLAGYSRLMETDEPGTLARLRTCRHDVVEPAVRRHGGRIVKLTGDGFLIEFASAIDGVECAVEIQGAMLQLNARFGGEPLAFRIGMNVGDLIIEDGDIYGDGVNIAARIEALAEPGGVLISRSVRDQVQGKLPYTFIDQGEFQVKNISRPVRVFLLPPAAIAAMPPPDIVGRPPRWFAYGKPLIFAVVALALAGAGIVGTNLLSDHGASPATSANEPAPAMSIVVLPFVNASGDADKDAFVEAVTEDLITDLSRISGSFVIASNTTFTYRDKQVDPRQVAEELRVRYLLTGSVRRSGDEVRVTATLIDGESGAQIWGERFERTRGDISELQQEVTGRIARALNLELKGALSKRAKLRAPNELDADDYAVRAWAEIWNKPQSKATNVAGLQFTEKALSLDPRNAQALSTAAYAYSREASSRWSDDPDASLRRAVEYAEKAVELDPGDADAQYVLSFALRLAGYRVRGEEANRLCVELNPNHAPGHGGLGIFSLQDGKLEEARRHFERALALSPRDPLRAIWYNFLATIELLSDRMGPAVETANRGIAANPEYVATNLTLAAALHRLGRKADAAAALARVQDRQPNLMSVTLATKRIFQAASPKAAVLKEKYIRELTEAGVPE